jgi:hypothetical protein
VLVHKSITTVSARTLALHADLAARKPSESLLSQTVSYYSNGMRASGALRGGVGYF